MTIKKTWARIRSNQFLKKIYWWVVGTLSIPRLFIIRFYQKKTNPTIVIGDSHTIFFTGLSDFDTARKSFTYTLNSINIPKHYPFFDKFLVFHFGGSLAYNALQRNSSVNTFKKTRYILRFFNHKGGGNRILISMGEIDIRVHILKQMERRGLSSFEPICDEVINRYSLFLRWINEHKKEKTSIYVWAPIASASDTFHVNWDIYGNEEKRNSVTLYFNQELRKVCDKNGIGFLSIYEKLVDENNKTLVMYYSSDGIHLNNAAWEIAHPVLCKNGLL